jgi:hypothetical protein
MSRHNRGDEEDNSREEYEAEFVSDDESYYSSDEECEKVVEIDYNHQEHMEKLNKKYTKSLEECHDAIKDNLKWVSEYKPIEPSNSTFPERKIEQTKPEPKEKLKRFKSKGIPLDISINYSGASSITTSAPEPVNIVCKFVKNGQYCPFGDRCKFSHTNKDRMVTSEGKTKKIWLCKIFKEKGYCRFGSTCAYAHSIQEVANAVTKCNPRCTRVKFDKIYINVGDRKCMRLHPAEHIQNFIDRTC